MFRPFRLGRLLGFDVRINPSFLALLVVVLVATGGLHGVAFVLVAFASVLVHELGHAVVARHLDVRVEGIELGFFGGAARMIDPPKNPGDEIAIAAAGPAVSFAIGGLALVVGTVAGAPLLGTIAWINLVLGAFNLLPALPMDGGRILRAALARRMPFERATRLAVTVARWVAGGLAVFAVVQGSLYLFVLAAVVWFMGSRELVLARFGGTAYRDVPEVEVLPRGSARSSRPSDGPRFVVRQVGGRVVVEPAD
jgi:Zn-dependent protease